MEPNYLIQVARGHREADLVLRNARVVNVFSSDILHEADIAIAEAQVVGLGNYRGKEEIDLRGRYVCPGLIDAHMHLESTMLTVPEFARAVVPHGTTAIVIDPHEITNVMGLDGIRYMLESSKFNPLSVYVMLPSCVPATDMETAGARLMDYDLAPFLNQRWVLGIAEMMNYPGVLMGDPAVLGKLGIVANVSKRIDGHAPGLSGRDLCAYIGVGIRSDHECTTPEEAREKLRLGMRIIIREGSAAQNLAALLPVVTPENARRCMFGTDDLNPRILLDEGHIDVLLRKAVRLGLNPVTAIQMATLNTAEYFDLYDQGAVAPGYRADLVVFEDLHDFEATMVFRGGQLVAQDGRLIPTGFEPKRVMLRSSVNVRWIELNDFAIPAQSPHIRVIGTVPQQLFTRQLVEEAKVVDGKAVADPERDILKIAVIERHQASGNKGLGFVKGFGLKRGAMASSVAHDSHNIIVIGTNDEDMMKAAVQIVKMQGGLTAVADGEVLESLPLPIAGLMSDKPVEEVRRAFDEMVAAAHDLGCGMEDPFMTMSFMALPVIPELKLTDKGLVDVNQFKIVPLFEN
jgi:adenine deaminase